MFKCKDIFRDGHKYNIKTHQIDVCVQYNDADNTDASRWVVRFSIDGYGHKHCFGHIDIDFSSDELTMLCEITDMSTGAKLNIYPICRLANVVTVHHDTIPLTMTNIGNCYIHSKGNLKLDPQTCMLTAIDFENWCIEFTYANAREGVVKKYLPFKDIPYVRAEYTRIKAV